MLTGRLHYGIVMVLIGLFITGRGALGQTAQPGQVAVPQQWADTYTPEELGAIERALWAANLTLEDLNFRKDYAEGYACFPIVRDWLEYPLEIAPGMDRLIEEIRNAEQNVASPWSELMTGGDVFADQAPEAHATLTGTADHALEAHATLETLTGFLVWLAETEIPTNFTAEEAEIIRQYGPYQMAWHDVFESPYSEEQVEAWDEFLKSQPDSYLYDLMSKTDTRINALGMEYYPDPRGWLDQLPAEAFPDSEPIVIESAGGRVGIGTLSDDTWEGDYTVLIDPGGNDHYINCRIGAAYGTEGRRSGYFVDLGGDDVYDCGDVNITLGAAVLGVAAFYDLGQGNDRYTAGSCSLGAAMCGVATFYDDGGSDIYEGKVFSQGAAGFGIGIMVDDSVQAAPDVHMLEDSHEDGTDPINIGAFDNDRYYAWANSQAFARTLGFAICSNKRGNEIYEAGGVYLHAPLFSDRYQSFSQGFAIGERDIDYAGGIALIVDYAGNDRYLGDVYNQGVGYWYSAGLLYDGGGNDTYEMTQYGQGSGIHLAVGGLIDVSGNDSYTMHSGLGVGGSHDYAASVLHDRGGNDQYFGNTSCNGGSLTNSAVIFIDRSGDDTYAGRRSGGINFGRPERGFISIGVLVDLSGEDDYLGIMDNGMLWSQTDVGVGWDIIPPPVEAEAEPQAGVPDQPGAEVELPEIISYEGELTQEVFDELWDIATRWEVGDNRYIVPYARDRLVAFGEGVLPYVSREFDDMRSGLAIRAFDDILGRMVSTSRDGVIGIVRENLESDDQMRRRVALAEISTLKIMDLEAEVAAILDDPDPAMQRRAIGVLGAIESHAADARLVENLHATDDEALVKVCMETLFSLGVYSWDEFRQLLDYPYISVRETLIGKLAENDEAYAGDLWRELNESASATSGVHMLSHVDGTGGLDTRALRSLLKVFTKSDLEPDEAAINAITILLNHEDWGVRADAVGLARHWEELSRQVLATSGDPSYAMYLISIVEPLASSVDAMLLTETDPYVLFVGNEE